MATKPIARIGVDLQFDNGTVISLTEGDIVRGLKYNSGGQVKSIDGMVRVIKFTTKLVDKNTLADCHHESYCEKFITISSMIIDSSDVFDMELTEISCSTIVSIDSVEQNGGAIQVGSGAQYKPLVDVIADAPVGSIIQLGAGVYDAPLTFTKDISIISDGTAELTGKINVAKSADGVAPVVHLEGVKLTGDAVIQLDGAAEFTLMNSVIGDFNPTTKTQPIHFLRTSPDPVMVVIEGNEFIASNDNSYNLVNSYGKFMDGSSISNNIFRKGCSTHNLISFFAVEDGATVYFNDNVCEYIPDANMVHIQIPGSPKCTIVMDGNSYVDDETIGDPMYDGLFIVQPFSKDTVSYADVTIKVSNTNRSPAHQQIGYIYMHKNNTALTEDQFPTIYVDGALAAVPVYRPDEETAPEETV